MVNILFAVNYALRLVIVYELMTADCNNIAFEIISAFNWYEANSSH